MCDPVGSDDIARRLGVAQQTVRMWRYRNLGFPEPQWTVSGRPCWDFPIVQEWYEGRKPGRRKADRRGP